jgi:hypothetical protein
MRLSDPTPRDACGEELFTSASELDVHAQRLSHPLMAVIGSA